MHTRMANQVVLQMRAQAAKAMAVKGREYSCPPGPEQAAEWRQRALNGGDASVQEPPVVQRALRMTSLSGGTTLW